MPTGSMIIFLTGHGGSSRSTFIAPDSFGDHSFVFPSMYRGQLCFVAHNLMAQALLESNTPIRELERIEKTHGVSTICKSLSLASSPSETLADSITISLDTIKLQVLHQFFSRLCLYNTLQKVVATCAEYEIYGEPDTTKIVEGIEIVTDVGIERDISIKLRTIPGYARKMQESVGNILKKYLPLEHKLGTWEGVMESHQEEMPYRPGKLENITIFSTTYSNYRLKFYLDSAKVDALLQKIPPPPQPRELQQCQFDDTIVMYMTNATQDQPIPLSDILQILGKLHVFVKKAASGTTEILSSIVYDSTDDYSAGEFYCLAGEYQVYDCTIPDNANVVWGACRDPGDF